MNFYYSKTTGGFYTDDIHGKNIPADAVKITAEQHQALLDAQSLGKVIMADANGAPIAANAPAPSAAQLWSMYQDKAKQALIASNITMIRCVENGVAIPPAWATYCKSLRAIVGATTGDATLPLPTKPAYPAGT